MGKRGLDKGIRKARVDKIGVYQCKKCDEAPFNLKQSLVNHMKRRRAKRKRKTSDVPMKERKRVSKDIGDYVEEENEKQLGRFGDQYFAQDDVMANDEFMDPQSDSSSWTSYEDESEKEEMFGDDVEAGNAILSGSDSDSENEDTPFVPQVSPEQLSDAVNKEDFLERYYGPVLFGIFKRPPLWDYSKIESLAMQPHLRLPIFLMSIWGI